MSKKKNHIHLLESSYTHSPPRIEDPSPSKKLNKQYKSVSLPSSSSSLRSQPINIPTASTQSYPLQLPPLSTISGTSCPSLLANSYSLSTCPATSALHSLPEFKVGSLPHPLVPSAWPVNLVNDFLTPLSNRSLSLSDPSSSSSTFDYHQLVFEMDD